MNMQNSRTESPNKNSAKQEDIQKRAYELFIKRGRKPGHEMEDWLQAERELSAGQRPQKLSA